MKHSRGTTRGEALEGKHSRGSTRGEALEGKHSRGSTRGEALEGKHSRGSTRGEALESASICSRISLSEVNLMHMLLLPDAAKRQTFSEHTVLSYL
jgi:hypothetical protein